jgi:polar amino acid transport system substrate-binding protein
MRTMRFARYVRQCVVLLGLAALFAALLPVAAYALDASGTAVTIDQTTGGLETRFTFSTITSAGETVLGIDYAFPEGTDLSKATADSVTLVGMQRSNVKVQAESEGTVLHVTFLPAVEPSSTLRVVLHDVITPTAGGNLTLGGTYTSQAGTQQLPTLSFQQVAPTVAQRIGFWLNRQSFVKVWNSVPILYGFLNPQRIAEAIPILFWGLLLSIGLIAVAFPAAIPIGLATAFLKMSKVAPLRWIAAAYINVIRGTPLFLQIYIAFFGLPLVGIRLPDFPLGVVVLAVNSGAYLAEIFRAGIQSINKGQFEAAQSLGMTYAQAMAYVIIPQTVRRVLPTMTSEFILLFKDTALLSAVGIFELMMNAKNGAANTGNVTPYTVAAIYYLMITIPLINWVGKLEHRLALSEGAQGAGTPKPKKRGPGWTGTGPDTEEAQARVDVKDATLSHAGRMRA